MKLIPKRTEKWLLSKTIPFLISRAAIFNTSGQTGSRVVIEQNNETLAAYDALKRDAWMYISCYQIASAASMLPFGVYKKGTSTKGGKYTLDPSERLSQLFQNPNPHQTAQEFQEAIFWSLELSGLLYIQCVPDKNNPQEMYVLDPRLVTPTKHPTKYITDFVYKVNGKDDTLSTDEVIFHRYYDPTDAYSGLSASSPAGDSINSNISSNEYNNSFYKNSGIPALMVTSEKRMLESEADRVAASMAKKFKGSKKGHLTMVTWGGLKVEMVQRSPKDMEFSNQKKLNREETLGSYGVPPVLAGLLESVNYSNSKEQKKLFWNNTMRPKLTGVAMRFTKEFGLDGIKRKFAYDLSGIDALQEDEEIKSRIAFNLSKSGFSWDEIRERIYNLPPLPEGVGKFPWVPTNMVPAILQMNGPAAAKPADSGKPGKPGKPDGPSPNNGQPENQKPAAGKDLNPTHTELVAVLDRIEKLITEETQARDICG